MTESPDVRRLLLGVEEYWQYDPTGDYLEPRLKGARLTGHAYHPIPTTDGHGGIHFASPRLGLELHLAEAALRRVAELETALRTAQR